MSPGQQIKPIPLPQPHPGGGAIVSQTNPGPRGPDRKVKTFLYLLPAVTDLPKEHLAPGFCMGADGLVSVADGDLLGDGDVGPGGVQAVMLIL